jgi:hypothetical protein
VSLLVARDFPRWTRGKLGLPATADPNEEIDRQILSAEAHLRYLIGDEAFDALAIPNEVNADRRMRFSVAFHHLVEARLYGLQAEHLAMQSGTSTQGSRSRTVASDARNGAQSAAIRAYDDFVRTMFQLGHAVNARAINTFYTEVSR